MLQIDIRSLAAGVHEMDFSPSPEDIGVEEDKFADIQATVRLDVGSKKLYAKIGIAAVASLTCDRTLEKFDLPVRGFFTVCFVPPEDIEPGNENDDLRPLKSGAEEIDLTNILRDTLLLSVPIRKIAPGADVEEIPTTYGAPADSDVDPRWSLLKGLGSDVEGEIENQ